MPVQKFDDEGGRCRGIASHATIVATDITVRTVLWTHLSCRGLG
jgi:hypothetical protein